MSVDGCRRAESRCSGGSGKSGSWALYYRCKLSLGGVAVNHMLRSHTPSSYLILSHAIFHPSAVTQLAHRHCVLACDQLGSTRQQKGFCISSTI